jgi:hypothetical protein
MHKIASSAVLFMLLLMGTVPALSTASTTTTLPAPYGNVQAIQVSPVVAQQFRSISQRYWNESLPACPEVRLFITSAANTTLLTKEPQASAFVIKPCAVGFSTKEFQYGIDYQVVIRVCSLYAHEYGHLLGIGHVGGWRSVMIGANFTRNAVVNGCMDKFLPPDKRLEWAANNGLPVFLLPYRR